MKKGFSENGSSFVQLVDQMQWGGVLSPAAAELVGREGEIPVVIEDDSNLRAKITDTCGMTCTFCHNEGTPVAVALRGITTQRSSIFSETNGVNFMSGQIQPDEAFGHALLSMRQSIGSDELHLTGGEPSLHRNIAELVERAVSLSYRVKMTSNGENPSGIRKAIEAGVSKIDFSIYGTTPEELAQTQAEKYRDEHLAETKIERLKKSMQIALDSGIKVDANIVMRNGGDSERTWRILNEYDPRISMRILNSLDDPESCPAIYEFLASSGAEPVEHTVVAGFSGARTKYRLPNGREIFFKQIRQVFLPEICDACPFKDSNCEEGFFGVRLYVDNHRQYKAGVCIQRMDFCEDVEQFVSGSLPGEIRQSREDDRKRLEEYYGNRIVR